MQSLPDARSQSFEELYGPPENFLEIEVTYRIARWRGSLAHHSRVHRCAIQ
jgi:hypothetical protein